MSKRISIPVTLDLREESVQRLSGGNVSPALSITSRAVQALEQMADGGLMLSSDQIREIEANYGKTIRTAQDVIRATEPRAGKKDGRRSIELTLDPAYWEPLEERAKATGLTVEEQVREIFNIALINDWVFGLEVKGEKHFADPEVQTYFRERLGEGFNLRDVMKSHRELERGNKKKSALRDGEEVALPTP